MHPYSGLPEKSFWKTSVASKSVFDISDLWNPKFEVGTEDLVSTFGSCFAQHIGNALVKNQYNWHLAEKAPASLSRSNQIKYNYGVFSARTGNIYTSSLLRQWVEWALSVKKMPDEVWVQSGKFYDPFRPAIEPGGFSSKEEVIESRRQACRAFRSCITDSKYFVFTLGLTERWINARYGYEYPVCPGTIAGVYDGDVHVFDNMTFSCVLENTLQAISLMRRENPELRFILTVSPVPLTATMTNNNVLVATMESKSILRAVAGQVAADQSAVDYFPAYEIISSPVFGGMFFEPNRRSVSRHGVEFVMTHFFKSMNRKFDSGQSSFKDAGERKIAETRHDVVCEEEILEAFGGRGAR